MRASAWAVFFLLLLPPSMAEEEAAARWILGVEEVLEDEAEYAGLPVVHRDDRLRFVVVSSTPSRIQPLRGDPAIRYIALDTEAELLEAPSDPLFQEQWALAHSGFPQSWAQAEAFPATAIAYIDSGVDASHEDLRGAIASTWNTIADTDDAMDRCGHGTLVAGILAAGRGNGVGIAGAAKAPLHAFKAFDLDPSGRCVGHWSHIATALRSAVDHGARVVSLSLGSLGSNPAMDEAMAYARSRDVVLVAAAGNFGPCEECLLYPARDPRVIAVGCSDEAGEICPFSSSGVGLDLLAPGASILSTTPGDGYGKKSGTSLSAPHVAATVALVRSVNPFLSAGAVMEVINRSADDVGPAGWDPASGAGRLNATRALLVARSNLALASLVATADGAEISVHADVRGETRGLTSPAELILRLRGQDGRTIREEYIPIPPLGRLQNMTAVVRWSVTPIGSYSISGIVSGVKEDAAVQDDMREADVNYPVPDPTGTLQCLAGC